MNKIKKTAIALTALLMGHSALSTIASFDYMVGVVDPQAQIGRQLSVVEEQNTTISASLSILPMNVVTGPNFSTGLSDSVAPIVKEFANLDDEINDKLLEDMSEYEGQFKNILPKNQLTKQYLASLPMARGDREFQCLTEALYFEARGESLIGQRAVAEVIMNRVGSKHYPNTICGVVNQGTGKIHQCQFSYTCDGHPEVIREKKAHESVAKIARLMIDGLYEEPITSGALFYHTTAVYPNWAPHKKRTTKLGVHIFYR